MLDAAVTVFSRRGFHDASVDEIAEAAGISKPMVYAYLGSKEELFTACLHREGTRMMEAIVATAVEGADASAEQQMRRGLGAFLTFVAGHRDAWSVLYRQARGQEPSATVLTQMRARMAEVVAGMLERGVRTAGGEVRGGEIETMGYALVGAAEAVADWLVDNPAQDPEVVATRLMNVVWRGAAAVLSPQVMVPAQPG